MNYFDYVYKYKESARPLYAEPGLYDRAMILKEIEEFVSGKNTESDSFMWVIKQNSTIEYGLYKGFEFSCHLAVVTNAFLMAFILGDYELAYRVCQKYPHYMNGSVEEVYFTDKETFIDDYVYDFTEVWLLSEDLGKSKDFFEKLCVKKINHKMKNNFNNISVSNTKRIRLVKAIKNICNRRSMGECCDDFYINFLVKYIFVNHLSSVDPNIWQLVLSTYRSENERKKLLRSASSFLKYYFYEYYEVKVATPNGILNNRKYDYKKEWSYFIDEYSFHKNGTRNVIEKMYSIPI